MSEQLRLELANARMRERTARLHSEPPRIQLVWVDRAGSRILGMWAPADNGDYPVPRERWFQTLSVPELIIDRGTAIQPYPCHCRLMRGKLT